MSDQNNNEVSAVIQTKTYVRGAFLFSTEDGTGYEEKNRNRAQDEVIIEDKGNLGSLKRQIQSKKQEMNKKKEKSKKQKQMLIPIRDTPVQPLPEPMADNNKCERATQEQFEYFQTYISLKQKQRKFQQEEQRTIELFEKQQDRFRKNEDNQERKGVSVVLEKDDKITLMGKAILQKKKGPGIKVVIKRKDNGGTNSAINNDTDNKNNDSGNNNNRKNNNNDDNSSNHQKQPQIQTPKQEQSIKNSPSENNQQPQQPEDNLDIMSKVRVVQEQNQEK